MERQQVVGIFYATSNRLNPYVPLMELLTNTQFYVSCECGWNIVMMRMMKSSLRKKRMTHGVHPTTLIMGEKTWLRKTRVGKRIRAACSTKRLVEKQMGMQWLPLNCRSSVGLVFLDTWFSSSYYNVVFWVTHIVFPHLLFILILLWYLCFPCYFRYLDFT